jgi:putative addiction module killer protein
MEYEIKTTNIFDKWLVGLNDRTAVNRIMARIYRMEQGNLGDVKTVGQNLFEMRFFFGFGYRVYYTINGETLVLLLCGGDKSTQKKDIEKAKKIMGEK